MQIAVKIICISARRRRLISCQKARAYGKLRAIIAREEYSGFTGQPLPDDADLRKERSDEIPEAAKAIMRELGIDPDTWEY